MKKLLFIIGVVLAIVGCGDKGDVSYIKGRTFEANRKYSILELSFKRDMSVVYTWKNSFDKEKKSRNDLIYNIDTDTEFTIYTIDNDSIWGYGKYYSTPRPYILMDNFKGDTLYVK